MSDGSKTGVVIFDYYFRGRLDRDIESWEDVRTADHIRVNTDLMNHVRLYSYGDYETDDPKSRRGYTWQRLDRQAAEDLVTALTYWLQNVAEPKGKEENV